ncbi:IS30 family transposase [Streptosporangium sandarakinum]|uniref:IS30 family transposase n=1 Tax=Streptosporangium sandarakinum TaxID=1260955 RepID=UPI003722579F
MVQEVCCALFQVVKDPPAHLRRFLTWDRGTELAQHAALTLQTDMPVYFAHARSPWERGTNEKTNGLIRDHLPKSTEIPGDLRCLRAMADRLNDRLRASLGLKTPGEVLTEPLLQETEPFSRSVPSTD